MENPSFQENVAEENPAKKMREQIVSDAFGDLDDFENANRVFGRDIDWFEKLPKEQKDIQAKEKEESLAECLELNPRFGSEEEHLQRIQEEMEKLSSPEEKMALLRGLVDFRSNSYGFKSLHDRLEKADETKKPPELKPTDETLVQGLLLRSIMDTSMMDENVYSDIRLAKRLEGATNERILEDFRPDYQRMLNEGKGWGINGLDSLQLMTELNKAGMKFIWSQTAEGKKVFTSETE